MQNCEIGFLRMRLSDSTFLKKVCFYFCAFYFALITKKYFTVFTKSWTCVIIERFCSTKRIYHNISSLKYLHNFFGKFFLLRLESKVFYAFFHCESFSWPRISLNDNALHRFFFRYSSSCILKKFINMWGKLLFSKESLLWVNLHYWFWVNWIVLIRINCNNKSS